MKQPEKWRETCDPFSLQYLAFQPLEILGYPHAGNDVFHVRGIYRGEDVRAFIKVARQAGASIKNEVAILSQLHLNTIPAVIDYSFGEKPFSVTLEVSGERLSTIVRDNENLASQSYLQEYGEALAKLHQQTIRADAMADRRFFHTPSMELLKELDLTFLDKYFSEKPANIAKCFCHGDFHYANILWQDHHISVILDFELSGYGNRDFDIAWSLILRPGQKFLKTQIEQQEFLKGYAKHGEYDFEAVLYYMAQIYVYFMQFSRDDAEYCEYVRTWLKQKIT